MRLRDDLALFEAAVTRAAEQTGVPARQIRKDFWLTEILRACARQADEHGFVAVFKGGTSLSKVFGLIERFSEDVDVLVVASGGDAAVNTTMKSLTIAAERHIGVTAMLDTATVDAGRYRAEMFPYPGVQPPDRGVLLELGARGGALPNARHQIVSIVAPIAEALLGESVEEAVAFATNVLSPARTLIEKLVIVHEAHLRPHGEARLRRITKTVRHYYDIWCLLGNGDVQAELAAHGAGVLAREVCQHSKAIGLPSVAYPVNGFASAAAFNPSSTVDQRKAYTSTVAELLWPAASLPTFAECLERVAQHAAKL